MDNEDYILNEVGLEIAKEKIAIKMRQLMEDNKKITFKDELLQIIQDRDEIEKGNIEIIKKYMEDMKIE